ncbi:MAG TPA: hypothetical protein PK341_17575 [Spirochaetota bacterium]|nr:hypothetical protein [Spirochaetota bacterium]
MEIGGISIVSLLGLLNLLLVIFQLLSGLHIIKVKIGIHKKSGALLFCTALLHGIMAFILNM